MKKFGKTLMENLGKVVIFALIIGIIIFFTGLGMSLISSGDILLLANLFEVIGICIVVLVIIFIMIRTLQAIFINPFNTSLVWRNIIYKFLVFPIGFSILFSFFIAMLLSMDFIIEKGLYGIFSILGEVSVSPLSIMILGISEIVVVGIAFFRKEPVNENEL